LKQWKKYKNLHCIKQILLKSVIWRSWKITLESVNYRSRPNTFVLKCDHSCIEIKTEITPRFFCILNTILEYWFQRSTLHPITARDQRENSRNSTIHDKKWKLYGQDGKYSPICIQKLTRAEISMRIRRNLKCSKHVWYFKSIKINCSWVTIYIMFDWKFDFWPFRPCVWFLICFRLHSLHAKFSS